MATLAKLKELSAAALEKHHEYERRIKAVSHRKMKAALKHRFFHNDPESLLVEVSFNARTNEMTNDNKTTGV